MTRQVAVMGIDGTVADVRRRLHLLDSDSPTNWADFFKRGRRRSGATGGAELAHRLAVDHDVLTERSADRDALTGALDTLTSGDVLTRNGRDQVAGLHYALRLADR